jgi:drug/metabolite transporter (DMT)-like permease
MSRFDTPTITFYELSAGWLVFSLFLPLYLYYFPTPLHLPSFSDISYLLILAVVCTAWLYMLMMNALTKISPFTVNLSFNLEPVYSIVLAFILFHENQELTYIFYIGLACIILSVALQMARVSKNIRSAHA